MVIKCLKSLFSQFSTTIFVALVVLAIVLRLQIITHQKEAAKQQTIYTKVVQESKKLFPESLEMIEKSENVFEFYSDSDQKLGTVVSTYHLSDDVIGYAGPIPLLLWIDADDKIIELSLLDNQETPSFIEMMTEEGFIKAWKGLTADKAIGLGVEAVSGATMSSDAISTNIEIAIATMRGEQVVIAKQPIEFAWQDYFALVAVAVSLICFFVSKLGKRVRIFVLALNMALLGFIAGKMLSLEFFSGVLANGFNVELTVLVIIALFAVVLPIVTGRNFYCSWICAYGCAQELASKPVKKKIKISAAVIKLFRYIKRAILVTVVACLVLDYSLDLGLFEPFAAFKFKNASWWTIGLAVIFLLASIVVSRFWCRFFCPTGYILNALRRRKSKTVSLESD